MAKMQTFTLATNETTAELKINLKILSVPEMNTHKKTCK